MDLSSVLTDAMFAWTTGSMRSTHAYKTLTLKLFGDDRKSNFFSERQYAEVQIIFTHLVNAAKRTRTKKFQHFIWTNRMAGSFVLIGYQNVVSYNCDVFLLITNKTHPRVIRWFIAVTAQCRFNYPTPFVHHIILLIRGFTLVNKGSYHL